MTQPTRQPFALFFTYGVSLKTWHERGNLMREVALYDRLAVQFGQVYFFTYGNADDAQYLPEAVRARIRVFPNRWRLPAWLYSVLLPLFYRKELRACALLKTNQMKGAWIAVLAKYVYHIPLVVRCGYEWLETMIREKKSWSHRFLALWIERLVYRSADLILVTSHDMKTFITTHVRTNSPIMVLSNYIDTDRFVPSSERTRANRIVFVGRLVAEKQIDRLIDAVDGLSVELVIIGDGPLRRNLEERAAGIEMASIRFLGAVPHEQLPAELRPASLFVFPSRYEGNPKALLEAMACGLAVIASDIPAHREIIESGRNGILIDPTAGHIRSTIQALLAVPEHIRVLGKNARETMLDRYSLDRLVEEETRLYERLLDGTERDCPNGTSSGFEN